jgi:hypothetical protein
MNSPRPALGPALVPISAILGTQVMVSLAVLSLSVLMPAVARDLALNAAASIVATIAAVVVLLAAGILELLRARFDSVAAPATPSPGI